VQNFTMVPAESLKPGAVAAAPGVPIRCSQPVAEINRAAFDQVEIVCLEKSVLGGPEIRVRRTVPSQYPIAIVRDPGEMFAEMVELWLAINPEG
jgi:hypothetical protein